MSTLPFKQCASSITLSGTTTTATSTGTLSANYTRARVINFGPNNARIAFGKSDVAATATSMTILPGVIEVFTKDGATNFAIICDAGTAVVEVTAGEGE